MDKMIDAALGVMPRATALGAQRLEVLAGNMANSDTPGFKARDIDFRAVLGAELNGGQGSQSLRTTHARHLPVEGGAAEGMRYRTPNHPSLDGNTVDGQMEQAAFGEAAVRYQASLDFLGGRIEGLRKALRGE